VFRFLTKQGVKVIVNGNRKRKELNLKLKQITGTGRETRNFWMKVVCHLTATVTSPVKTKAEIL